ncbi:MAG: CBU_0592 family membrane protein [Gemmatimonadaceae bacterium]
MLLQLFGIVGALLVLGAYFALQRGWLTLDQRVYHAMNFVGAGLLTWIAATAGQVGLTLLEGVWALLSVPGLVRPPRRGP